MLNINIMKAVELEMNIKDLDKEIDKAITEVDIQTIFVDAKYSGDKLRDMNLMTIITEEMVKLTKLITRLKDIETEAIKINDNTIYFKCENRIAKLINIMEVLKNKYLL